MTTNIKKMTLFKNVYLILPNLRLITIFSSSIIINDKLFILNFQFFLNKLNINFVFNLQSYDQCRFHN